jgi:hypothetical protein
MIGPAELEDIRLDLQATGPGVAADDTFHPCFHPGAAMSPTRQQDADDAADDQPSCVSSNSSALSSGAR